MNNDEKMIVYKLFKKGEENFSSFDKLLVESNPEIRAGLDRLGEVDSSVYRRAVKLAGERRRRRKGEESLKRRRRLFAYMAVPAAACLLVLFTFIYQYSKAPARLGAPVTLYVSSTAGPDRFFSKGGTFAGGEELKVAFEPGTGLSGELRQGVLFTIDSTLESAVYYRYRSSDGPLDYTQPTSVEKRVYLKEEIDYIYFFIIFSESPFDEDVLIDGVKEIVRRRGLRGERFLERELEGKSAAYIYLRRGGYE